MSNPDRFRFNEMFDLLREHGFEMKSIEYIQWRQLLMVLHHTDVWDRLK